jgi:hypothetical protein
MKVITAILKELTPYIYLYDFYQAYTYGIHKTIITITFIAFAAAWWLL